MTFTKRERIIIFVAIAAVSLLVLDVYALAPLLARRDAARDEKDRLVTEKGKVDILIARGDRLDKSWEGMLADGMKPTAAEAESQLLRALRDWSAEEGVKLSSLRPERSQEDTELIEITVHAAGTGSMRSASRLLWRIETAKIPVKIKMLQLGSRKDGTDDLSLHLKVSTLHLPAEKTEGRDIAGRTNETRGGR